MNTFKPGDVVDVLNGAGPVGVVHEGDDTKGYAVYAVGHGGRLYWWCQGFLRVTSLIRVTK